MVIAQNGGQPCTDEIFSEQKVINYINSHIFIKISMKVSF